MKKSEINQYLKDNWDSPYEELTATTGLSRDAVYKRGKRMGLPHKVYTGSNEEVIPRNPAEQIKLDIEKGKEQSKLKIVNASYKEALREIDRLEALLEVKSVLDEPLDTFTIEKPTGQGGEATLIALASDWHIEEEVRPENVNGLNFYNLEESKRRATKYFQTLLRLVQIEQHETKVDRLILGLLGDFISGDIHPDVDKSTLLQSRFALKRCKDYIVSGIDYILENSDLKLTIVCHTGNHGRKDHEQMIANEGGNSIEGLMYDNLFDIYSRKAPNRVNFVIPDAYHSYVTVYDKVIRFHHGHAMRFGGGVGGFTIPVNKAIAQWNRAKRADIDCFGHFHQCFDGGNFVANGSMIGFNAYAINIKAGYEKPAQMLFGIHSKLGKYVVRPIFFD